MSVRCCRGHLVVHKAALPGATRGAGAQELLLSIRPFMTPASSSALRDGFEGSVPVEGTVNTNSRDNAGECEHNIVTVTGERNSDNPGLEYN